MVNVDHNNNIDSCVTIAFTVLTSFLYTYISNAYIWFAYSTTLHACIEQGVNEKLERIKE